MQALQERPPYVTFGYLAEEDRNASIESGRYQARDVAYAFITPPGSKDIIERRADEWLAQLNQAVIDGRYPAQWYQHFKQAFELWKQGEQPPALGTGLEHWPGLSPSQYKALRGANIRTIEDCAGMNEEAIQRVGMGARALKERAAAYLEAASGPGKLAERAAALEEQNRMQAEQIKALNEKLAALQQDLAAAKTTTDTPAPPQVNKVELSF